MSHSFRSSKQSFKKQPQDRGNQREKQQKEQQHKPTLAEECGTRLAKISEARREKQATENRSKFKKEEDEVMRMCHGPDWRTRYAWEPPTQPKVAAPEKDPEYDEYEEAS